jgi:hypothetical protein
MKTMSELPDDLFVAAKKRAGLTVKHLRWKRTLPATSTGRSATALRCGAGTLPAPHFLSYLTGTAVPVGSVIRPRNKSVPVFTSRIANRNGRSARMAGVNGT